MVADLADAAKAVPDAGWTTFGQDEDGTLRQWADLGYVPGRRSGCRSAKPRRCIGLRLLKPQGELFDDGHDRRHFAVVTSRTERGDNVMAALRLDAADPEDRMMRVRSLRFNLLLVSARLNRFSLKITLRFAGTHARGVRVLRLLEAFPCRVQPTG